MSDPMKRLTPYSPKSVFTRAAHFEAAAAGVLMQPYEWEFVLALDGIKTAGGVAQSILLDATYLEALCERLQALGLVELRQITLEEYRRQAGLAAPAQVPAPEVVAAPEPPILSSAPPASATDAPPVAAEPAEHVYELPAGVSLEPELPEISAAPSPAPIEAAPLQPAAASLPEPPVEPVVTKPLPDVFAPLPSEAATDGTPSVHGVIRSDHPPMMEEAKAVTFSLKRQSTGMPIRPLLDFIVARAGGSSVPKLLQQLAVYRVFRKVPSDLVLSGNLPTLSISDANFDLQSRELYDAIVHAIEETFGVPYRDDTMGART